MKKSYLGGFVVAIAVSLCTPAFAQDNRNRGQLQLKDVVSKVSKQNYVVLQDALRVYQAKESITVARGNLLPKLNIWNIIGTVLDPLGSIQDVAPFLVPANWFRLRQTEVLYMAEREGYRSLWANEVLTAKQLYYQILADKSLLDSIRQTKTPLDEILRIARIRERLGGLRPGTSREIEIRSLALEEDIRRMEVLVREELLALTFRLGYRREEFIDLAPVAIPDINSLQPLAYDDFEFRALDTAAELRQFEHLIKAIGLIRGETMFAFLGGSSTSRGVAGGVFDHLPLSNGLGFGTGAEMRISEAERQIIQLQKTGVEETIKRQLDSVILSYNLDLDTYANQTRRLQLSNESLKAMTDQLRVGGNIEVLQLLEASKNQIAASASVMGSQYRFLMNEDKLARLLYHGDYSVRPAAIEELRK